MIGFMLRVILLLALLTFATLEIARALPSDDGGLGTALFSNDCQPPCFMGIRPGITTTDEAARLLQAHPWVTNVRVYTDDPAAINWDWSGQQPAFLSTYRGANVIFLDAGIVHQIYLDEDEAMGALVAALGLPDQIFATTRQTTAQGDFLFEQFAIYSQHQVALELSLLCPTYPSSRWRTHVTLWIPPPPREARDFTMTLRRGFSPKPKECR